jgi:hypothetical protein
VFDKTLHNISSGSQGSNSMISSSIIRQLGILDIILEEFLYGGSGSLM